VIALLAALFAFTGAVQGSAKDAAMICFVIFGGSSIAGLVHAAFGGTRG
jgi:hypothetical protein